MIDSTEYERIKRMYQNGLVPMIKLAERYHVSRQAIYKLLCRLGVDTKKNGGIEFTCYQCKNRFKRHKSRMRVHSNHRFCSLECWFAFVRSVCGGEYKYTRQGQRVARRVVSRYHELQPDEIVHHEDKNTLNNTLHNLRVFANQSDHIRHHRGFDIKPVWSGLEVIESRKKKNLTN